MFKKWKEFWRRFKIAWNKPYKPSKEYRMGQKIGFIRSTGRGHK